jgi:hypothetical protein
VDDLQDGFGRETWPDGAEYIGEFLKGQKVGKGNFKWSDGAKYEGIFDNNMINGTYTI